MGPALLHWAVVTAPRLPEFEKSLDIALRWNSWGCAVLDSVIPVGPLNSGYSMIPQPREVPASLWGPVSFGEGCGTWMFSLGESELVVKVCALW